MLKIFIRIFISYFRYIYDACVTSLSVSGTTVTYKNKAGKSLGTIATQDTWRPIGTTSTNAAAGNHNHNSTYLALSGGTMTGKLNMSANFRPSTNNTIAVGEESYRFNQGCFGVAVRIGLAAGGQDTVYEHGKLTYSAGNYSICSKAIQSRNSLNDAWAPVYANSFSTQSSIKYKKNIEDMTDTYAKKLLEIRPVSYDLITGEGTTQSGWYGMIAEEVAEIEKHPVMYIDGEIEGLDYSSFVPQIIKMIQIQQEEINELKEELFKIKN